MSGKVIVIVDDEPDMAQMLSAFLRIKGYEVYTAYSGQDGLALIESRRPGAVLLDLMLPDIDGLDVCQRLRSAPATAEIPILIISARTEPAIMARAEEMGASGYLTKPIKLPILLDELQRLTGA
jgi:DNA-binding response OmpR family regulator